MNIAYSFNKSVISESLAGSIYEIINFFKEKENMSHSTNIFVSIIEIILVILIAIGTLIYEEIIVINKCGLGKNVRESIIERGFIDQEEASDSDNNNDIYISLFPVKSLNED